MKAIPLAVLLALVLTACGKSDDDDHVRQPKAKNELELIRNTDKIGYSGGAVADKVQGAIDENAQRSKHLEQATGWQTGEDVSGESDTDKDTE